MHIRVCKLVVAESEQQRSATPVRVRDSELEEVLDCSQDKRVISNRAGGPGVVDRRGRQQLM